MGCKPNAAGSRHRTVCRAERVLNETDKEKRRAAGMRLFLFLCSFQASYHNLVCGSIPKLFFVKSADSLLIFFSSIAQGRLPGQNSPERIRKRKTHRSDSPSEGKKEALVRLLPGRTRAVKMESIVRSIMDRFFIETGKNRFTDSLPAPIRSR